MCLNLIYIWLPQIASKLAKLYPGLVQSWFLADTMFWNEANRSVKTLCLPK